jgi:FMN phosphatase YigB (HAD superfamily)
MAGRRRAMIRVVFFDLGDTLVERSVHSGVSQPEDGVGHPNKREFTWVPGAPETVSQLRHKGIAVGIISNTGLPPDGWNFEQLLAKLPEDFDALGFERRLIILSGDPAVGSQKPEARIFEIALARAADTVVAEPGECLFCTEELHHTFVAQRLGFKTARLLPSGRDIGNLVENLRQGGLLPVTDRSGERVK